ncbi:MAG: MCE family protein [Pirellulales bacterium]|nr:MCE family protein [Pirellulales bacterium]
MNKPYKLRYVNQLVGTFLLLVVLLVLLGVFFVARTQSWFMGRHDLVAYLPESQLDGLQRGTPIIVLGRSIGEISSISYAPDGENLQVTLSINQAWRNQIFVDSQIRIRRRLAGAGEAYLEITRGPNHDIVATPSTPLAIISEPGPTDDMAKITQMFVDARDSIRMAQESISSGFTKLEDTSAKLDDSNAQLQDILRDVKEFSPRLSPLADQYESMARDIRVTNEEVRQSNVQLQSALTDVQQVTPKLEPLANQAQQLLSTSQDVMSALRAETESLPGTVDKFRADLDGAQEVIDGMKQNWLIRRYLEKPHPSSMIPPARVSPGGPWP